MASVDYTLRAAVKVDGRQLSPDLEPLLEQVVVDRSLHLPAMYTITLLDPARDVLSKSGIHYGSRIEISGTPLGGQVDTPLITGDVQIIRADYLGSHGARIAVTGFDSAYQLMRGTNSRTYVDMTDSEICRKVVSGAGIDIGDIEATSKTYHHVLQQNTSDWNFLHKRAERIGYEIGVEEDKFFFRKPVASSGAPGEGNLHTDNPLQLVIGKGLLEFHGRVSGSGQIAQVEVRGWDSEHKKVIVSSAKAGTVSAELASVSPQKLAGNGDSKYVSVDHQVEDTSDADAVAQALAERISSSFAEVEGVARGNPRLNAGTPVSISGVADMFAGRYVLTRVRHIFDKDGYRTHFEVTGRQERSLLGLVTRGGAAAAVAPAASAAAATTGSARFYGAFRGVVTANDDPLKEARVKLQLPQVLGDQESDWAPVTQLGAGPNSGAVFIPEVGDEVLVTFEEGDPSRPIVIGGLYNGMDKPHLGDGLFSNGKVLRRGFVSRKGHRLVFFDDDHDSGIAILTSDGQVRVALKETDKQLHLFCNGDVVIEAGGNVSVKASKELKVSSGTALTIESQESLTLTGHTGVKLESDATVEIKGTVVKLN